MTQPTKPTIDEQIAWVKTLISSSTVPPLTYRGVHAEAILATLERVKAAEAGLPVEPANRIRVVNITENGNKTEIIEHVLVVDYDTIRAYAVQKEAEVKDLKEALVLANRSADDYMIQKREAEAERDAANDKALRVLRGQFTQICSYCGWEANREGAQWNDLQSHIKQCEHHPLVKAEQANRRMVELLKEPSDDALQRAGAVVGTMNGYEGESPDADHFEWFKAMSAELLKEIGE